MSLILIAIVTAIVAYALYRAYASIATSHATVLSAVAPINSLLSGRFYIRDSQRRKTLDFVNSFEAIARKLHRNIFANSSQKEISATVLEFINNSKGLTSKANDIFVDKELEAHAQFFDTIESQKLTPAQRRACVVNEDNNRILAGAGSGKTSCMIGRAGYLIASGNANPEELLLLAFAKKAAEEMQERMEKRLKPWIDDKLPTIKTFHALGLEIIGKAEGKRPDITPMAEDERLFAKFIDVKLNEHCTEKEYLAKFIRYCNGEKFPYRNPFDFDSIQEYYEYIRSNELTTLKGEVVKSFEECIIANFLSSHAVNYRYEAPYKVDTSGPDYRLYKPDFWLPDYDIYIEHFALNSNGQPPAHFDCPKYLEGIKWKRELHNVHGTKLLETYSYLKRDGLLESTIEDMLRNAGVVMRVKSDEELLEELRLTAEITGFAQMICGFLKLYKQSDHDMGHLKSLAAQDIDSTRLLLLLDLFEPLLDSYENELEANKWIDFEDMIRRATKHVEAGTYVSSYRHIMVDEFQDISRGRARLVTALIKQNPENVFFSVGDDWQSIYRFTGSDIGYTRDFEEHFGVTATTALDITFRFNDMIGEVSSKFVLQNPAQIKKTFKSISTVPEPAVSFIRVLAVETGLHIALKAVNDMPSTGGKRKSVLVLGRYNFTIENWRSRQEEKKLKSNYPELDISLMTSHGAKGKEADYVVILGLGRGKFGFPSERPIDQVMEFLLPASEPFKYAEERRLYYVSLTRARNRVYVVYNPMEASSFILEMLKPDNGYLICTTEFDTLRDVCDPIPHIPCPTCHVGYLVPRRSSSGIFAGCGNFPYCKHTEKLCPQCGGLMIWKNGHRACISKFCKATVPICSKCGGEMLEREGPYGKFWGCVNYRKNSAYICTNTVKIK